MVRGARRGMRMLLGAGAVLVALVLGAAALSQTAAFRDWLRAQVVARLNASLWGRVAIGRVDGNLFGHLVLRDVRVTLDGRRVLAVRRAEARYDLRFLLHRRGIVLDSLDVRGLDLALVEGEGGWSLVRAFAERTPAPEEGPPTRLAFDHVTLRGGSVRIVGPGALWKLRDVRLDGGIATGPDGRQIELRSASFALAPREVQVRDLAGRLAIGADGTVVVEAVRLRTGASSLDGSLGIGAGERPRYRADLALVRLDAGELRRLLRSDAPRTDVSGTLHLDGPANAVGIESDLRAGDAALAVTGTLDLAARPLGYDLRARVADLDLAALLGPERPATRLGGTLSLTGTGTSLDAMASRAVLALRDSTVGGRTVRQLDLDARISGGEVGFEASAASEAGSARARGTVVPATTRYDLALDAERLDLATVTGDPTYRGAITGTLAVAGVGVDPASATATAHLALAASRVRDVELRSTRADLHLAAGRLAIDTLMVDSNAGRADVTGELALTERALRALTSPRAVAGPTAGQDVMPQAAETPERASHEARSGAEGQVPSFRIAPVLAEGASGRLRYDVQARDLRAVGALLDVRGLAGALTVRGTASGSLQALDVEATVEGHDLSRDGIAIEALAGNLAGTRLGAAGGHAEVTAHADDVRVAGQRLTDARVQAGWTHGAASSSSATVVASADGEASRRHELAASIALGAGETRVQVERLRLDVGEQTWRADGQPVVVVRGGAVATDGFALRSAGGVVRVEGTLATAGASDLRGRVEGVDVAALAQALRPGTAERVEGTLSGEATLEGTLAQPRLTAHLAIAQPRISGVPYARAEARVRAGPQRVELDAELVQEAARTLALTAASPVALSLSPFRLQPAGEVTGTLRALQIDLAFLDPLMPQLTRVGGTLDADLAVTGTLERLALRGPVTIAGGRARVLPLGLTYDPIELRLRLDGQAVSVDTLRVVSGDGVLEGSGTAAVTDSGPTFDLRVQVTRFPLFANRYGNGAASGWLWMTGSAQAPVVEGTLETDGLVLRIPETLPGQVHPPDPTIEVVGPGGPPAVPVAAAGDTEPGANGASAGPSPGIYERAAITVQLTVPRNAWIRRSDAEIELRGWMTAWKKPADELRLAGEIDVVRGWFQLQGKSFDVEEGQVTFTGGDLKPVLHVVAAHRTGAYTVRAIIGGTLAKPSLTLESEPSLSQADILSVLLFGKTAAELSQPQSRGLREQTLGIVAGYAASELRQSVADALGVDTLQVDTGGGDLQQSAISVGKYVSEDIFVSLAHRFSESVQELRIEYFFNPRWTLETSVDTRGRSAVDVFWKLRY